MDVPSPRIPVGQTKVEKGISRPKNLSSHPAGDWNKESRMWVSKHPTKYTYRLYIYIYIHGPMVVIQQETFMDFRMQRKLQSKYLILTKSSQV